LLIVGKGVSFWCGLSSRGITNLHFYNGRLNSQKYISILDSNLLPSLTRMNLSRFVLVQDPHPAHRSGKLLRYYRSSRIDSLIIPGASPDCKFVIKVVNPIEMVFLKLKKRLFKDISNYQSIQRLREAVSREWELMRVEDAEYLINLIRSFPRRLAAIIHNQGYNTKY
jgi:hypothetical protein